MKRSYLEVTYRRGKPIAAYLYLPRRELDRSNEVRSFGESYKVDFTADGRAIGIEILDPADCTTAGINAVLAQLQMPALAASDLAPLAVA